jgi:hypothetical protein
VAVGGDLRPERLIDAYRSGIFPWYSEGLPILWHSPDPRFVLEPKHLQVNRSLRKSLRRNPYRLSFDTAFLEVVQRCSEVPRPGQDGTWITNDMITDERVPGQTSLAPAVAFRAFRAAAAGNQSMTDAAFTKVGYSSESYDIGGYYDHATNFRFTPPKGQYRLVASIPQQASIADGQQVALVIYKNGSLHQVFWNAWASGTNPPTQTGCCDVDANGTDYFEVYYYQNTGGAKNVPGDDGLSSFFSGSRI